MKLILRLLAGILAGLLIGLYAPDALVRLMLTVKMALGQLIGFVIPLIILFFIASGIANLQANGGKLLGRTVSIAYGSTLTAGILAYLVASSLVPMLVESRPLQEVAGSSLTPFVVIEVPALFGVMSALAAAFIFGLGISVTGASSLKKVVDEGKGIIDALLAKVIIPMLPFYIAGVFAGFGADGSVFETLKTFGVVLVMAILMHWLYISVLYIVTGLRSGRSPWALIRTMLPAYVTALGTMSSAATIPVTLRQAKANGVTPEVANFSIPLFASIHLAGSTITLTTCSIAVMQMMPDLAIPGLLEMLPFIMMLGVVMIAAPGAPGGAVMAALGLLTAMLGFGEAAVALMIALYMAQDSFGTACNITCDGALSIWVDKAEAAEVAQAKA
ncbi:dicarboxylate/amino acid:cation symporter [Ferrimonas marina]|uniref:Na+/H+-dicarboxylate symporter n=1 Tax=Ferrimonas marina TaxID=299255 RepID=A0A1M5Z3E1_9GAMM|nr:dicarboxylate/amino acid:cation symporter [Ferrimonas marina]SHI18711.1 Na+/H+-dicarboxylate symporter [Ferrimonas marina]